MPKPKITVEDVQSVFRDRIGAVMMQLWQQEAYIKKIDEFVMALPDDEPQKEEEVSS